MSRSIGSLVARNWWLKLLSLVLAFILWLTLVPAEKIFSEKTFQVPLETRNAPADLEIVERPLAALDVTVRAPNRLLAQMTSKDITAVLNLERATVSQEEYPLNPNNVSVPADATVVRVFPNKVRLKLDRSEELMLEVQPVFIGKIGNGFRIEKIEILPSKVFVRGPESQIKAQDKVLTSPMDITGLTASAQFEPDLILPRPELRFTAGQTRATVKIILGRS